MSPIDGPAVASGRHVIQRPTVTKARSVGEYCQHTDVVSSVKAQTTIVLQRGVIPPWIVSDSRMLASSFCASARV